MCDGRAIHHRMNTHRPSTQHMLWRRRSLLAPRIEHWLVSPSSRLMLHTQVRPFLRGYELHSCTHVYYIHVFVLNYFVFCSV